MTITTGDDLQAGNGPVTPPVTPLQVKPVTHQRVPLCSTGIRTPKHILQDCPTRRDARRQTWPEEVGLQEKLWGWGASLKHTADFALTMKLYGPSSGID